MAPATDHSARIDIDFAIAINTTIAGWDTCHPADCDHTGCDLLHMDSTALLVGAVGHRLGSCTSAR